MEVTGLSELVTGGKAGNYMRKTIKYVDAPKEIEEALDEAEVIYDFLPSPEHIILKKEKAKITISLDKHSLDLYKQYANKHNTKYQPMINKVLSSYAEKFLSK